MHLLSARSAPSDVGDDAVDLGQSPAELVILSAAESELSGLAAAHARRGAAARPTLRLANLLQLHHPLSVDLYVEKTLCAARLIVVRLLGGRSYWSYGVEQLRRLALERGIGLVCLPGDDRPDPELARRALALENVLLPEVAQALGRIDEQLTLADQEEAVRIRQAARTQTGSITQMG